MIQVRILPKASLGLLLSICSLSFTYKIDWLCGWDVFNCDDPFSIEQTLQFRCKSVDDCPVNFMCCSHKCFRHKICQPDTTIRQTQNVPSNNFEIRPGECDVIVGCDIPLPKAFTKSFECFQDNDCPDYYKCCFVSCYNHKVCQPAKGPFAVISTGILTERSTSVTEIPSIESTVKEAVTTKSSIDGSRTTAVSETVPTTERSAYLYITEATTVVESTLLEIITTKNLEISSTTIQQIDEGVTEPFTTTQRINTDTTTSKSIAEPTILTTQEITTQVTTTEILTKFPVLTSSVEATTQATTSKILTEPPLSTDDFEASGYQELIDDDEDGREEVEDNAAATATIPRTTKLHHTKYFTEQATIETTPFQPLSTKLSIENNYIEGSGDSMTIEDDDEDNRKEKKNGTYTLITNTISSASTITLQPIQSLDGLSEITTETDDFEITGDLEITEDDEDEINKGGSDITATVLKVISSTTAFKLTTPQQAESSKNLSETTFVTETQSLKGSTRFLTENYKEKTKEYITVATTTIMESIRNNETATLAPTHQISGANDSKEVITLPPPIIESTELENNDYLEANGDLGTVGINEDKSKKEQNKNNTSFETNPTFTLSTLQQAKTSKDSKVTEHTLIEAPPLRESTEFTETVDFEASGDSEVIGDDEDMETIKNYTTTTKLTDNIEILIVTTTQQSASTQDTTEVTTKTNQSLSIEGTKTNFENDDSEASGDFEIIGDDEDERGEHQEKVTTSTTKVLIKDKIQIIQPETDDFEASEDLEIIGDVEHEAKVNLGN